MIQLLFNWEKFISYNEFLIYKILLLYNLADTYPAGVPRQTYNTKAQVIKAPLFAGDKNPRHAKTVTFEKDDFYFL
jgi:hypothetical protein